MTWFHVVKSLHIVSVLAWMAALLYLPRIYAYHAAVPIKSDRSELFKVMERRLLRGIMNPAMILTWVFGLLLLFAYPAESGVDWKKGWLHVKLAAVVGLTALHHVYALWRKTFERDANARPARFYKWWNEAPIILAIVIVFMVVGKPF
jgi:protoporphyrinogen IX oxidase